MQASLSRLRQPSKEQPAGSMSGITRTLRGFASLYRPGYAYSLVHMLRSNHYRPATYLNQYWHTKDFGDVRPKRQDKLSRLDRSLLWGLWTGMTIQLFIGLLLIYLGIWRQLVGGVAFGAAVIVVDPVLWAHLAAVPCAAVVSAQPKASAVQTKPLNAKPAQSKKKSTKKSSSKQRKQTK